MSTSTGASARDAELGVMDRDHPNSSRPESSASRLSDPRGQIDDSTRSLWCDYGFGSRRVGFGLLRFNSQRPTMGREASISNSSPSMRWPGDASAAYPSTCHIRHFGLEALESCKTSCKTIALKEIPNCLLDYQITEESIHA